MARGRKTGGRKRGTRNRATVERALIAERTAADAKGAGRKLAVEMLDQYMHIFAETAARLNVECHAPRKRRSTSLFRWALRRALKLIRGLRKQITDLDERTRRPGARH
jgi:hypothetical protein